MSNVYSQPGNVITCDSLPYARNKGQGVQWGKMFGVAQQTKAISTACEVEVVGVQLLDATNPEAWTDGATIYWDDATKKATTTVATNLKIGHARGAKGSAATTGYVRLSGAPV
jgi:predicted RecA/RadA family phage recombinase